MRQLANLETIFALLQTGLMGLLCLGTFIQWLRFRKCAYNIDTGFWLLVVFSFGFMGVGSGAMVLRDLPLFSYTAKSLLLMGFLLLLMAVLRLFSWSAHKHASTS